MAGLYVDHIKGDGNAELQSIAFERLAVEPSTGLFEGRRYYNTATKLEGLYNGTMWVYGATGAELQANKDAANGYAGLTLFKINFKNVAGTFISFFTNTNTAARTYTYQDRDGTIADNTDITGAKARANHAGTQLSATISDFVATVLASVLTGFSTASSAVVSASDTVLGAIGKLQAQITAYSASTKTLTNTTIDANGTGNTISNLETADFAPGVLNVSSSLAGATATQIPSALAVSQAIASAVSGVAKPMGGIDASTNPNYPAANVGEYYRITVAGLIGGASGIAVQVGDELHCYVTGVAGTQATVGANWTILNVNVDQATASVIGLVALATQAEAEAQSNTNKAVTPSALANFLVNKEFTIGDASATSIAITHNLGNQYPKWSAIRASDKVGVTP